MPQNWAMTLIDQADAVVANVTTAADHAAAQLANERATLAAVIRDTTPAAQRALPAAAPSGARSTPLAPWVIPVIFVLLLVLTVAVVRRHR